MYSLNFTIMYLQRSWTSNISLSDHSLLSLRLLQLCPKHSLARDGLMKQAQRKDKRQLRLFSCWRERIPLKCWATSKISHKRAWVNTRQLHNLKINSCWIDETKSNIEMSSLQYSIFILYIYTLLYYILHCVVNVNDVNNQQYNIIQREERTDACTKITI